MGKHRDDLLKINLKSLDISFQKHDIVKLMLVQKLIDKHKDNLLKIKIYTSFEIIDNKKVDIYFEDWSAGEVKIYKIKEKITENWIKKIERVYKNLNIYSIDKCNLIVIPLGNCPDNISEITKWLDKYV